MSKKRKITEDEDFIENKLYKLIVEIENKTDTYLNFENIFINFKELIENNKEGILNRCVECKIDMGRSNPRQLCGKTFCCFKEN